MSVASRGATSPVSTGAATPVQEPSHTVDQILGRQGAMLGDDAQATVLGEPLRDRDPLRLFAELRALRESGTISAAEFEMRKSTIGRDL